MSDSLLDGRRFRVFTIVDNFSRVSPAIEVDVSLTGKRVVKVLERAALSRGLPEVIRCDNGSKFISKVVDEWAHQRAHRSLGGLTPREYEAQWWSQQAAKQAA